MHPINDPLPPDALKKRYTALCIHLHSFSHSLVLRLLINILIIIIINILHTSQYLFSGDCRWASPLPRSPTLPLFRLPRSPLLRRTDLRTAAPARPCNPRGRGRALRGSAYAPASSRPAARPPAPAGSASGAPPIPDAKYRIKHEYYL